MNKSEKFILWFDELGIEDVPLVGGKNASLGEMYRLLTKKGIRIPNGFAITATAYQYLLKKAGVEDDIKRVLKGLNVKNISDLAERGRKVREIILKCEFPADLRKDILVAYERLCNFYKKKDVDVAVRSSATAEDLPDASFAGQQETYLNIKGEHELLDACRKCFASLFTNRAIAYREEKGFDHFKVYLSIGVQKMVRSDLSCSGVMFSIDTETGFKNSVIINASYGLGENIVQGAVNPDEYYVFKPTLLKGFKPIIGKVLGEKNIRMIYSNEGTKPTKNIDVPLEERKQFCLKDEEVLQLSKWACMIEDHYSQKRGRWTPMDMEWAKDGETNQLFIVQARPETVQSQKQKNMYEEYSLKQKGKIIVTGKSVGNKIAQGEANVIKSVRDIEKFRPGQVLVTEMTDPDWVPIMRIAKAIVTNRGGRTCFSGDTKILTNKGFMTFEQIYNNYVELSVLSLNRETLKIEWKPIYASMRQRAELIEIETSQTGRMHGNSLKITPDHKIITIKDRQLIDKEIKEVINNQELVLLAQKIPSTLQSSAKDQKLAYLLGAISTDGHIYKTRTHGEVTFIQKPTKEKEEFISAVNNALKSSFNKEFKISKKQPSSGFIRGKEVIGEANSYRCYSKQIAQELLLEQENLSKTLLTADLDVCFNFLAGVIDGDGSYNKKASRINIYCSKEYLLQGIIIACLRIGTVPQVSTNRNIYNVQIVEKIEEIFKYTKRLKGKVYRPRFGTRFFSAKQLFSDIIDSVNYKGRIKSYVNNNLVIDAEKIKNNVLPLVFNKIRFELDKILNSNTRMQRINFVKNVGVNYVYNISVQDNHNYIVFTDRYTPIIVNNCHAAIVSRELGIPCVVGTNNATEKIKSGQKVTVSCAEGEEGKVYDGLLKFDINKINLEHIPKTRTKVMVNIGNPEQAFDLSFLPVDGVGLAREEFIVNEYIRIHPMALIRFNELSQEEQDKIERLTRGYKDKKQFFIDKLSMGVGMLAAAFWPNDVIVRMSDFKTNEYSNLVGGSAFEPKEENPMIGWRGAARYYSEQFKEAFALECKAMKKVRDEFGLTNLKIMIPMCRTVDEGKNVLKIMSENGLVRGKNDLQVYVMCELPSNVILADKFSEIFDGFSIGSNDLTQTTLGVDRDSSLVAHIFDERNEAVKRMVAMAIATAKKYKRKIGICGDAPSTYPEFAEFLVQCGIDSISLSPDAVIKTKLIVANEEKRLKR